MAAQPLILTLLGLDGTVESGGLLYSYVKDTTTPLALYTDIGLATPETNPVVASALGLVSVYFDDSLQYSITAKTADEATTLIQFDIVGGAVSLTYVNPAYTVFPLVDASWTSPLATPLGARRGTRLGLDDVVFYPRDYGCVGDGSTADDTNFWACVDAAKAAGGWVDGEGLTYALSALKTYTGSGVYKWRNLKLKKAAQTATDNEWTLQVTGPDLASKITLASNAAVGASTLALSTGTGVAINDVFILISDTEYATSYDTITIPKTEFIRCRSIAGTTLTLAEPLESSHTTANNARIYKFAETCEIHFRDVEFIGGGTGLEQGGARFNRCVVHEFSNCRSLNNEYIGFSFNICGFRQGVRIYGEGSDLTGFGYLAEIVGCNNPLVDTIAGRSCRHAVTLGASYQATLPDSDGTAYIMGRNGQVGLVDCDTAVGAVFDVHPGHPGGAVGKVTGSQLPGNGQESVTIQSPDWTIGDVRVIGCDQGILIQHFGKPSDEPEARVCVGNVDLGRGGSSSNVAFLAENLDDDNDSPLHIECSSLNGNWPGLISLDSDTTGGAYSGPIYAHFGSVRGVSRTTHTILLNSSQQGRVFCDIDHIDVQEDAGSGSIYAINALGADYEGQNAGEYGAKCTIHSGRIVADNTAINVNDGVVALDPLVDVSATTFSAETGIGVAQRTRREKLSKARTYYVRGDGADTNSGLIDSASGAFLTIAAATNAVKALDLNGYDVTIYLADATWAEAIVLPTLTGAGRLIINGNTSTPTNVVISATSADAIKAENVSGRYLIRGVRVQTTTSGSGIFASGGGVYIEFESVDFGVCVSYHVNCLYNAEVFVPNNYTISAGTVAHWQAIFGGVINAASRTITISNTPAFSGQFANSIRGGIINAPGMTFTGSATGKRYDATHLGLIYTGGAGATYLPGNSSGATATGGVYD